MSDESHSDEDKLKDKLRENDLCQQLLEIIQKSNYPYNIQYRASATLLSIVLVYHLDNTSRVEELKLSVYKLLDLQIDSMIKTKEKIWNSSLTSTT